MSPKKRSPKPKKPSPPLTKNDTAWLTLFARHDIVNAVDARGSFEISADQINTVREARLMTKFDHLANLPTPFADNSLAILPKTRGTYVIGRFDAYQKVRYDPKVTTIHTQFPTLLQSIDHSNLYSESAALNCAFVADILADLVGERVLPTVSGRMSTSRFDFTVDNRTGPLSIQVNNSQCEIDGGYESDNFFLLIEAKNQLVHDFLIRQLYYPYRLWQNKITKKVVPVFMTYSNDTFSFFKYEFQRLDHYNSLQLLEQRNYVITAGTVTMADLQHLLATVRIVPEPTIPFPQADRFDRVVDLLGLLLTADTDTLDKDFITTNYDFDERQTNYYSTAGRYLGLISSDGHGQYEITREGRRVMALPHKSKYLALVSAILSHEVFHKALQQYFAQLSPLTRDQAVAIMKSCSIYNVNSEETYYRRAQSVVKWVEWIIDLVE